MGKVLAYKKQILPAVVFSLLTCMTGAISTDARYFENVTVGTFLTTFIISFIIYYVVISLIYFVADGMSCDPLHHGSESAKYSDTSGVWNSCGKGSVKAKGKRDVLCLKDSSLGMVWFVCFLILIICWLPTIVRLMPGSVITDTVTGMLVALGESDNVDNPLYTTLLYNAVLLSGFNSGHFHLAVALFCSLQALTVAAVIAYCLAWQMRRGGVALPICAGALLIFALLPVFPVYAFSMAKDSLFGLALLIYMQMLAEWVSDRSLFMRVSPQSVIFVLINLIMPGLRNGAWAIEVVVGVVMLVMEIMRSRSLGSGEKTMKETNESTDDNKEINGAIIADDEKTEASKTIDKEKSFSSGNSSSSGNNMRLLIVPVICILIAVISSQIISPLNEAIYKHPERASRAISVPIQQMAYIFCNEAKPEEILDADELEALSKVMRIENFYYYDPLIVDQVKEGFATDPTDAEMDAYNAIYRKLVLKYPAAALKSFVLGSSAYYIPWISTDVKDRLLLGYASSLTSYFPDLAAGNEAGIEKVRLTDEALLRMPIVGLLARIGIYAWGLFLTLSYLVSRRKYDRIIVLLAPTLFMVACCFSPVNGYYRYALPVIMCTPIAMMQMFCGRNEGR